MYSRRNGGVTCLNWQANRRYAQKKTPPELVRAACVSVSSLVQTPYGNPKTGRKNYTVEGTSQPISGRGGRARSTRALALDAPMGVGVVRPAGDARRDRAMGGRRLTRAVTRGAKMGDIPVDPRTRARVFHLFRLSFLHLSGAAIRPVPGRAGPLPGRRAKGLKNISFSG